MRKKQLRKPDVPQATATAPGAAQPPRERRARVRNRLLTSVVLCAVAVIAAGTPTVVAASGDAADTQELVDLAGVSQQAIALSHSLADERDSMVEFVAAGRTARGGGGVTEAQRSRVDRQADEIRAAAPADVRKQLKKLPKLRQQALSGRGSALVTHEGYSDVVRSLQGVSRDVAHNLPARAQNATAAVLPDLARAIDQASAARGLLRGALAAGGGQPGLTGRAQQARAREEAALADFEQAADGKARNSYSTTVNGADVDIAERYLARLTDRPYLSVSDRALNRDRVDATLSARIAHMRGVQSSFAAAEVKRLEGLRDDDVTALQIRAGLVGLCLLLAVGISVQTARSLARPLSVLRRGSQRLAKDPAGEEPVSFRGRNDEFADVVRALNTLRGTAADLQRRSSEAEAGQDELAVAKAELTERYELLRREHESLQERLATTSESLHGTFVHLAQRTLGLAERQLGVIEGLEEKETDPDRLGTLFKLDHLATRTRRHSENLLLLAGAEHPAEGRPEPVPLVDVLRAAISEIEHYERVELDSPPPHVRIGGPVADDISHLVAELLDNATAFSAPESEVRLSGWRLENGEVMLSVEDSGIGMDDGRLGELNARLGEPEAQQPPALGSGSEQEPGQLGMGLYVVARLAVRHGLRVRLRKEKQGGIAAVVTVPAALLPDSPTLTTRLPEPAEHARAEDAEDRAETRTDADTDAAAAVARAKEPDADALADVDALAEAEADVDVLAGADADADTGTDADTDADTDTDAGPDTHAEAETDAKQETGTVPAAPDRKITPQGLPKRTPVVQTREAVPPRPRKGGVSAEELRRRLGGFQQGAREGLRDAAALIAAEEGAEEQAGAQVDGGTAEEARK